ncbi:Sensor histidine kinase [Minicystis rosea]|nr:Sensor histidine kinase [Minicystis rosea]
MRLADFIQANGGTIAKEWEAFARSFSSANAGTSDLLLRDEIEEILCAIVDNMREPQSSAEQAEKSKGRGKGSALDRIGQQHALQRVDIGFRFDEAVSEFRALRASVVRLWEESQPQPDPSERDDLIRFNEAIDQVLTESMGAYTTERDRTREQFLAILGHDLRTPLGTISMAASVLGRDENLDERHAQAAARILRSAGRMERLLNDMLDLTRIRLGAGLPLTRASMDLEATCRQVLDELGFSHPDRVLRFEPIGDLRGEWDADRLAQIVSNLVGNAMQHGDEAAPVVVSAWVEGEQVMLAVHNEGKPIPREDMQRIFKPLVQSESRSPAGAAAHLGLGLFIVREIVLAHGGEIAVSSSKKQGTTFTVRLPRS